MPHQINRTSALLYRGRFAPSPTGPVHFGTLVAAVGSYLQAKVNKGQWLIRIDDVDITRRIKNADIDILNTLSAFGFEWHGEIFYQSKQNKYYQQALDTLNAQSRLFPCLCTRKQLSKSETLIYPGNCRLRNLPETKKHAIRLRADDITIEFVDIIMGLQKQNIKTQCGDFIIQRRDTLFAYQLAVVVDDAMQGITEVVRGADLLECTNRQIYLQQLLHYATPDYCHLPLVIDSHGNKISKSEGGAAIDIKDKEQQLLNALIYLGQQTPAQLHGSNCADIWAWAIQNWDLNAVPKKQYLSIPVV